MSNEAPRREGTSLSNALSHSQASLATISFQPRSAAPSLTTKVAEAPVFVPRSAHASTPPVAPYAYTYEEPRPVRHPLQYHLYAPPFPHVSNVHPTHHAAMSFFMDPHLHEELHRKQEALYATANEPIAGVPESLHVYHSLVPLEPSAAAAVPSSLVDPRCRAQGSLTGASGDPSRVFGRCSHIYKATCALDGKCYVLRRFEHVRLHHPAAISAAERWRKIRHPNLVAVREAFTTRAFGDDSVVFVYDFHPLATTLYMEHMTVKPLVPDRRTGRLQPVSMYVPERVLWSYACQLASLLRAVHAAGLAARCMEPSKVLRTAHHRLRLTGCAILDVLAYQPPSSDDRALLEAQQRDDLAALGRLLLCTGCNNVAAAADPHSSAAFERSYSTELHTFVQDLMRGAYARISDVLPALTLHMADEFGYAQHHADLLEADLLRELENGRLVRLLCKLATLREETTDDVSGEQYVIQLFRDMVFHATDEHGRPTMDLSHILVHLNKLDAGIDEKVLLTSRDELSCLVVSYADLKQFIETALA